MSILSEALHRADVWQRNLVDRNRDAVGNVLQDISPAASFLGRGWGDVAAFGLGAAGSGLKHGSNIKDIGSSGLRNAAIGASLREGVAGAKNLTGFGAGGGAAVEPTTSGISAAATGEPATLAPSGSSLTGAIQGAPNALPSVSLTPGVVPPTPDGPILSAIKGTGSFLKDNAGWIGPTLSTASKLYGPEGDAERAQTELLKQRLADEQAQTAQRQAWQRQTFPQLHLARRHPAPNPYV